MNTLAVDNRQSEQHLDMDAINRELSCVHQSTVIPALYIDDCEGFFPFELNPRNQTDQVLLHLNFLREELRQNQDLVYVEDLTDHLKAHYGKLIPHIRDLLSKPAPSSIRKRVFVGRIHPAWHALLKGRYGMDHDRIMNTIKVSIDKRWFFVELDS